MLRVKAPGSCGELVQGVIGGEPFLVTCPIDLYAEASVLKLPGCHTGLGDKAALALQKVLRHFAIEDFPYRITLHSALPRGKGMASSSADIAAVSQAAALSVGKVCPTELLGRVASSIEPTDGIFHEGIVAFHHLSGTCRESLGKAPALAIAVFDMGGSVDTLRFNQRNDLMRLHEKNEDTIKEALYLLKKGIARRDARCIGAGATMSARANQTVLYKPCLEELLCIAESCGAVGVNIAHSGTVIGALFDPAHADGLKACVRVARDRLAPLRYMKTVRLISGGLVIEGAADETHG